MLVVLVETDVHHLIASIFVVFCGPHLQAAIVAEVVREVELMTNDREASMDHPNLLKYLGIFREPDVDASDSEPTPWIITECADCSLEDLLKDVEGGKEPFTLLQFFVYVPPFCSER